MTVNIMQAARLFVLHAIFASQYYAYGVPIKPMQSLNRQNKPTPRTPHQRHNKFHHHNGTNKGNMLDLSSIVYDKNASMDAYLSSHNKNCGCPDMNIQGQAIIIVVDSNSGSTWLGQLIDSHKCTLSFIPPDQRADGHYRPSSYRELLVWMRKSSINARGRPYGVMLSWNFLERIIKDMAKQPKIDEYNSLKSPRIIFYSREPIFQVIKSDVFCSQ
jgi:hypothetical protein